MELTHKLCAHLLAHPNKRVEGDLGLGESHLRQVVPLSIEVQVLLGRQHCRLKAIPLVDDALDYSARQAELGKTVGDDFSEGKITLPVILAFRRGTEVDRKFWKRTLEELDQEPGDLEKAQELILKYGALDDTISRARHYAAIARDALGLFSDGEPKNALTEVVDFCVEREF